MRITTEFGAAISTLQRYPRFAGQLIPMGVPPFHPAFAVAVFLRAGFPGLGQGLSALLAKTADDIRLRVIQLGVGQTVAPAKGFYITFL